MPSIQQTPARSSSHSATLTTILGLLIFIIAFFPDPFAYLIRTPFRYLTNSPTIPSPIICNPGCTPASPSLPSSSLPDPSIFTSITPPPSTMSWTQKAITLPQRSRGSYLITREIETAIPEIKTYKIGLLNLFMQHTSAALSLNENYDTDVREDMSDALDRLAPEDRKGNLYRHSAEGLDDMPAHIKSALIGASVTVPIKDGGLATGTWQGIWYLEFRAAKQARKVVATIQGEKM